MAPVPAVDRINKALIRPILRLGQLSIVQSRCPEEGQILLCRGTQALETSALTLGSSCRPRPQRRVSNSPIRYEVQSQVQSAPVGFHRADGAVLAVFDTQLASCLFLLFKPTTYRSQGKPAFDLQLLRRDDNLIPR